MRPITDSLSEQVLMLNCDEPEVLAMLTGANTHDLGLLIGGNRVVFIDNRNKCQT